MNDIAPGLKKICVEIFVEHSLGMPRNFGVGYCTPALNAVIL